MKIVLLIVVVLFAVSAISREMWEYVTRKVPGDPFFNAQRLWRRGAGAVSLVLSTVVLFFYDAVVERWPMPSLRIGLVSIMLALIVYAVYLAFKDVRIAAEAALAEQRKLSRLSVSSIEQDLVALKTAKGSAAQAGEGEPPDGQEEQT